MHNRKIYFAAWFLFILGMTSGCDSFENAAEVPTPVVRSDFTASVPDVVGSPTPPARTPTPDAQPTHSGTLTPTASISQQFSFQSPTPTAIATATATSIAALPSPVTVRVPGRIWFTRYSSLSTYEDALFWLQDGRVEGVSLPPKSSVEMIDPNNRFALVASYDTLNLRTFSLLDLDTHQRTIIPLMCDTSSCELVVSPDRQYGAINYRCAADHVNVVIAPLADLQRAIVSALQQPCPPTNERAYAWEPSSQRVLVVTDNGLVERSLTGADRYLTTARWWTLNMSANGRWVFGGHLDLADEQTDNISWVLDRRTGREEKLIVPRYHRADGILSDDGRYLVFNGYAYSQAGDYLYLYDRQQPMREPVRLVEGNRVVAWQPEP